MERLLSDVKRCKECMGCFSKANCSDCSCCVHCRSRWFAESWRFVFEMQRYSCISTGAHGIAALAYGMHPFIPPADAGSDFHKEYVLKCL